MTMYTSARVCRAADLRSGRPRRTDLYLDQTNDRRELLLLTLNRLRFSNVIDHVNEGRSVVVLYSMTRYYYYYFILEKLQ